MHKQHTNAFARFMSSSPVMAAVSAFATICLMVAFIAAGLNTCIAPPTTEKLANATVMDKISPFNHQQLVDTALAVREYSFGDGERQRLYETVARINIELSESGAVHSSLAPDVSALKEASVEADYAKAFAGASDRYVLTSDAISHLDDVFIVGVQALIATIVMLVLGVAALAHLVFYRGLRALSTPLIASGAILLAVFAILGAWALVDFYGLFTVFHSLFFSEGTWTFNYDSLLICSLPTEFWMGMAGIWLGVTCLLSVISIGFGVAFRIVFKRS